MKRNWVLVGLLLLLGLALATSQVLAAPAVKKTPPPENPGGQVIDNPSNPPDPGNGGDKAKDKGGDKQEKNKQNNGSPEKDKDTGKGKDKAEKTSPQDDGKCKPDQITGGDIGQASADCSPDTKSKAKKQHFRGELINITDSTITIKLASGEEVTFDIGGVQIHFPTLGKGATWEDLNKNVKVNVVAVEPGQDGQHLLAVQLHVVPSQPSVVHVAGAVSAYDADQQTMTVAGQTFQLDEKTKIVPQGAVVTTDAQVTVIVRRDVTGGRLTANAIVVRAKKADKP